jgi:hypothetical protein
LQSLRSYLPKLSKLLGIAPTALYERQRELIRASILPRPDGVGRDSGIAITPEAVASVLVAAMAANGLKDTRNATKKVLAAHIQDGPCGLSGEATFGRALTWALSTPSDTVEEVRVYRDCTRAEIAYRQGSENCVSIFTGKMPPGRQMHVIACLDGYGLSAISRDLFGDHGTAREQL